MIFPELDRMPGAKTMRTWWLGRLGYGIGALAGVFAAGVSASAFQPDSYRPGLAYSAFPAPAPQACVEACEGDAGCGGWNFVSLREGAAICEMLREAGAPLPSPGNASGSRETRTTSSRLVRLPDAPATRIGSPRAASAPPAMTTPQAAPTRQAAPALSAARTVMRQPPVQPEAPLIATTPRRPAPTAPVRTPAQAFARTPLLKPLLDEARPGVGARPPRMPAPRAPAPQAPAVQVPLTQVPPHQIATPRTAPWSAAPQQPPAREAVSPFAPRQPQPTAQPGPAAGPLSGLAGPTGSQSLFGYLHDDVSDGAVRTPAPADPGALDDPGAPVQTLSPSGRIP